MSQGLQENAGRYRETSPTARSTEVILNDNYAKKVQAFVSEARISIRAFIYAWRWYDSEPYEPIQRMNNALLEAVQRGLQVRILVDTEAMKLKFRALGFDVKSVVNTRMLHAKAIQIDDKTLVVGSHNWTKRANNDNYELSLAVQDPEAIILFNEHFDAVWNSRG